MATQEDLHKYEVNNVAVIKTYVSAGDMGSCMNNS
jgi:hypothetical protein